MLTVADWKIPLAREAFADFGAVRVLSTSEIRPPAIRDADILLVRSETRVGRDLLEGSRIQFVGTATIGTDHIDLGCLKRSGIGFSAAPGSNADSVKEYVAAALLRLAVRNGVDLAGKTLGVVGVGNIGSRVVGIAQALGMTALRNDPPLERAGGSGFVSLDDLMGADFISVHVPLTKSGADPTWHLLDAHRLSRLGKKTILINTSRGPVVDNAALKRLLFSGRLAGAVLDVWENEPFIDIELLERVDLGTAHIAGYSLDGKVRGTQMVYEAACRFLGREPTWRGDVGLPAPATERVEVGGHSSFLESLDSAVRQFYDIEADDRRLRGIHQTADRAAYFRGLRRDYPVRREFSAGRIGPCDEKLRRTLRELGFGST